MGKRKGRMRRGMGMRMVLRVTEGSLCDLMAHKVVAKPIIMCV